MANWKREMRKKRRAQQLNRRSRNNYSSSSSSSYSNSNIERSKRIAKMAKIGFGALLGLTILGIIVFQVLAVNLPSPDKVIRREGFSTQILDRNGEVLYDIYNDERRTLVTIEQIPDYLKEATIAIEDKNFYKHRGFDPFGTLRGFSRLFTRGRAQGGSTLTQQLVKNVLLSSERSVTRKVKEFVLATRLENSYSKDQILQMYLNEAPYGGTAWGVGAASEMYFGKEVSELNLTESAFLAGLPQRPSTYSPYSSTPDAYIARTENVLRRMREDGYIDREAEESAKSQLADLEFQARVDSFKAPHFVQYVESILEERYGESIVQQGGLTVTTTLDLDLQEEAQKTVAEEIETVESLNITNGAAVVIDPETGEILAMVGSKDFYADDYDGQFNVATALRQPGSAIKPITYVTALKEGYTASTLIMDTPTKFPAGAGQPPYEPENYDGKFRGPVQLRYALANSMNIPAVKVLAMVGIKDTLQTATDLGITSLPPTNETLSRVGLSLTLGGGEVKLLELTSAYGAFMNGGHRVTPIAILKVEDQDGKTLEEVKKFDEGKRVLSEEDAFLIADILSDNQARSAIFGTNSLLNVPGVAVKTGTTNDKRDNWTIGGNSNAVVGVWVGNNDNSAMTRVASGVSGASPIWREIMLKALEGKPKVSFEPPKDIVTVTVDKVSGYKSHDGFEERVEFFKKGTEPGEDTVHVKLKVCPSEGKLATPSQVAANQYEEREYFVFKEEDPTGGIDGENMWQRGILEWISTENNDKYNPPTDYCSGGNLAPLNVEFSDPKDRTSDLPNKFTIKFRVDAINKIELTELEIDGTKVRSFTSGPYEYNADLSNGPHKIRAIAYDDKGNKSDRIIEIGVNAPWDE